MAADANRDSPARAAAYGQMGLAAQQRNDLTEADKYYALALGVCERLGDRAKSAVYAAQLGIVASLRHRDGEGKNYVLRALADYSALGDKAGIAECHYQLGGRFVDDPGDCQRHLELALALHEELGAPDREALVSGALGSLAKNSARYRDAERWFARSLALYEAVGDSEGIELCRMSIDDLREVRGQNGLFARWSGRGRRR